MGFIKDIFGGGDAADAATDSANIQAGAQREALDYLKEREAIPQQFREGALQNIGGIYGLEGGTGSQQELIDRAQASPLYAAIMGGQQAGEQTILRNASALGGLRSGNSRGALTDYGSQLDNRALLESYNQQMSGLQGLAALPSNANQIASTQAGIGNTLAMGDVAAQQAAQAKKGQNTSLALGLLGNETVQSGIGAAWDWAKNFNWSDKRLKDNIQQTGTSNGHNVYSWIWNKAAEKLGLYGNGSGVIADEVESYCPEAVIMHEGFKAVNYKMIGVDYA